MRIKVEQKITIRHDLSANVYAYVEDGKPPIVYISVTSYSIDTLLEVTPELERTKNDVQTLADSIYNLL